PSGSVARIFCRRIGEGPAADGVVHVKLTSPVAVVGAAEVPTQRTAMILPGLVGSGVLWLRACREAETLYDASEWLTLEGGGGVGRGRAAWAGCPGPGPGTSGGPRPPPSRWGPRLRPARTGPSRPAASCSTAPACWSSGTWTG